MNDLHYIGFDVHKKSIQFCAKLADGRIAREGRIEATRAGLAEWIAAQSRPWKGALEATMFSAWIYDTLKPHAVELKVAHPAMLKAIAAGKHASDRLDAQKIADVVRMDWIPAVWMAPPELRSLRGLLRYRNLVVRQATQTKNRIASTLMEQGVEYSKQKLHGKRYFEDLLGRLEEVPEAVRSLLRSSRSSLAVFESSQRALLKRLKSDPLLTERVRLLDTVPGVGEVTALTWALEIGDPHRFPSVDKAVSYCGLVSPQQESADKQYRQPLSKKRNAHLQTVLIEAAHLVAWRNPALRALYEKKKAAHDDGVAAIEVARKLVAYLLAVDKSKQPFVELPALSTPSSPTGKTAFPPAPPTGAVEVARRSSPSRVRPAAASSPCSPAAPLTAPGRRAETALTMGGSGGKARRRSD